jgi:AcrR family transcriptional regulator
MASRGKGQVMVPLNGDAPKVTRAERTLATRRRMVKAAYDLFCEVGYLGTTMTALADRADVATPTIYYTFGTKAQVLGEALGAAIVGFDLWREPPAQPDMAESMPWHDWWAPLLEAPTAHEALAVFVESGAQILQRVGPLIPALFGSTGDPEAAEIVRASFERQFESYRLVLAVVAGKAPGLRPSLDLDQATDAIVAVFSADAYRTLTARGWSHEQCGAFFFEVLTAHLLPAA